VDSFIAMYAVLHDQQRRNYVCADPQCKWMLTREPKRTALKYFFFSAKQWSVFLIFSFWEHIRDPVGHLHIYINQKQWTSPKNGPPATHAVFCTGPKFQAVPPTFEYS